MLTVRDVMTSELLTMAPETTLRDAAEVLTARHVSGAPVLVGCRVVGTISASDILAFEATLPGVPREREAEDSLLEDPVNWDDDDQPPAAYFTEMWEDAGADVSERFYTIDGPEWDVLAEHIVAEAMSAQVLALPPSASIQSAAEYMEQTGVHRVLIVDADRLVGIVTTMDITRVVARHQMTDTTVHPPAAPVVTMTLPDSGTVVA